MPTDAPWGDTFPELIRLIDRLRGEDGCPWDRAQKKPDVGRYLIEEAYEVIEALEDPPEHLREELGDLLFQILFLCRLAEEAGEFTLSDVLAEITAKMVRRHPHVFGGTQVKDVLEVRTNWERIKAEVEHKETKGRFLNETLARSLPTLAKAQRITSLASKAGFDWPNTEGVLAKIEEEVAEFRAAVETGRPERIADEAGDLLFTVVNLCRFAQVDAESALRSSLQKFIDRFSRIETVLAAQGKKLQDASQAEMDLIWDEVKKNEGTP